MKNIASIDLNLLKAFDALLSERRVKLAAMRVGITQPAMSNALNRLRHLFEDDLFIRTPGGMEPTARARQLANQILIHGRPIPLAEIFAKVESVTVESARAAGRALIKRSRPAVAALGPGKGLEGAATIIDTLARRAA